MAVQFCDEVVRKVWVTYSSKHLLAVVLLSRVEGIIDKSEAGRSATTELGLESENRNVLLLGLEGLSKLDLDVSLGHVRQLGVYQLNDLLVLLDDFIIGTYTLSSCKKRVLQEFTSV